MLAILHLLHIYQCMDFNTVLIVSKGPCIAITEIFIQLMEVLLKYIVNSGSGHLATSDQYCLKLNQCLHFLLGIRSQISSLLYKALNKYIGYGHMNKSL